MNAAKTGARARVLTWRGEVLLVRGVWLPLDRARRTLALLRDMRHGLGLRWTLELEEAPCER